MPAGATVFDAARWNGIAIDSTCGGHGTCKKCRMRVVEGDVPVSRLDPRTFSPDELRAGLAPGLPRAGRAGPAGRGAAAGHPAQGGDRRRRPAGDPAPRGAEALRELPEPTLSDQRTDLERLRDALPDLELRADLPAIRGLARALRPATTPTTTRHRRRRRRGAHRRRAGRHDRAPVRHRLRPRYDDRRRDPARPGHRHPGRRRVAAQPAAALRRRRDHPDQRDDDGPGRARPAHRARPTRASTSSPARSARRAASTAGRSTRSPSRATPR